MKYNIISKKEKNNEQSIVIYKKLKWKNKIKNIYMNKNKKEKIQRM